MKPTSPDSASRTTLDPQTVGSAVVSVALLLLCAVVCIAAGLHQGEAASPQLIASRLDGVLPEMNGAAEVPSESATEDTTIVRP